MIQNNIIKTKVVGVDISLGKTKYAIVDVRGNIIAKASFSTTQFPTASDFVTYLSERIIAIVEENCGYESVRSVGISSPSGNFLTGCMENATNMPWKGKIPIAAMLRDQLGLAVALGNDVHARALGEHAYGAAHGMKDFIVVNLGYGVGSCVFSNGEAHLGVNGFAGEIGHTCVEHGGRLCGCGNRGCLEAYVGAKGVVKTAEEVLAEDSRPSLLREVEHMSPRVVSQCCDKGDQLAIEVFRRTGFVLGLSLANYASVINPEAIIICGGLSHAGKWLLEPTNDSFEEHVFHNLKGKVKLISSNLDDLDRDVLGASALAWNVKEYSLFL